MSIAEEVQAVAGYWDGHPEALPDFPTPVQQVEYDQKMAQWEAKFGEDGPPSPPAPPTIPGPALPGGGMPAARITDLHAHGGILIGPGCPKVLIGGLPAIRMTDQVACPVWDGLVPHVSGMVLKGSSKVLIAGLPAARVSDPVGPPSNCKGNAIALGCSKVLIGESPAAGGGGADAGGPATPAVDEPAPGDPTEPADPNADDPGASDEPGSNNRPAGPSNVDVDEGTHWLEIELVDEMEQPVPGEPFEIRLPNGKMVKSSLDANGLSRIDGIKQPGWCYVCFPRLDLASWERWSPASKERPTAPIAPSSPESPSGAVPGADGAARRGAWRLVQRGECLSSIADEVGHTVNTIWNHDQNKLLQARRLDPNVLQTGDAVFVPNLRPRKEQVSTDQHQKFCRIGVTTTLNLTLMDKEGPRASVPYTLEVAGEGRQGMTSPEGYLEERIPARARVAKLTVGEEEYRLVLGALDPISDTSGVQQRLNNLGFACGPADGNLSPRTIAALNLFRLRAKLPTSNRIDEATLARLSRCHDLMQPLPPDTEDDADDVMFHPESQDDVEFDESEEVF